MKMTFIVCYIAYKMIFFVAVVYFISKISTKEEV